MLQLCAASVADTHAIAAAVARLARRGDIVLLSGEMGAGKTAFAQGFGRALGVTEPITSPTFTLVHSYPLDGLTLHHADLYRLERTSEVADLALGELAAFDGIVLIEWGNVIDGAFPDHLSVHMEMDADAVRGTASVPASDPMSGPASGSPSGDVADEFGLDGHRRLEVSASGPTWAARWASLTAACEAYAC